MSQQKPDSIPNMNADEKRLWNIAKRVGMGINPAQIERVWKHIKEILKRNINRNERTVNQLEVIAGRFLVVYGSYQGRLNIAQIIRTDPELNEMGYIGFATNGTNYKGSLGTIFRAGSYDITKLRKTFPNDRMGSLFIKEGYQATIYDASLKGRSQLLTGSNNNVTQYGIGVSSMVIERTNPELQKAKERISYQDSVINGLKGTVGRLNTEKRQAQQFAKDSQFQMNQARSQVRDAELAHQETKKILDSSEEALRLSETESDNRALAGAAAAHPQPEMFQDFQSIGNTLRDSSTTNTIALAALVVALSVSFYTISKN